MNCGFLRRKFEYISIKWKLRYKIKRLKVERYRLYQQQWEKDFVTVDRLRDKMRNNDPDYVETQIVKAVTEVKSKSGDTSDT